MGLKKTAYRPDIDGLRAVAVLAVILFHCGIELFSAGFVGVDIFFVISGYLITSIILKGLDQNNFDLAAFHAGRISRIFPAYVLVIFCSLAVGVFLMTPGDLDLLFESSIKSFLLIPNLYFARKAEYFAPESEELPLLHFWSLGVELQFYLLWPFVLLFLYRLGFSKQKILIVTMAMILGSLVYGEYLNTQAEHAASAYYLLAVRGSALLIGSLLAIVCLVEPHRVFYPLLLRSLGWLAIVYSCFFVSIDGYAGLTSLIPSIGTALIIYSNSAPTLPSKFLQSKILIHLGVLSYSLYLWHWPLLAYYRYIFGDEVSVSAILSILLLSYLLALTTRKFVEIPVQTNNTSLLKSWSRYHVWPMLAVGLVFILPNKLDEGLTFRSEFYQNAYINTSDKTFCHGKLDIACKVGDPSGESAHTLIIGDSHGAHMERFIRKAAFDQNKYLNSLSNDGCFIFESWDASIDTQKRKCNQQSKLLRQYAQNYEQIILVGCWVCVMNRSESLSVFESKFSKLMLELNRQYEKVVVVEQIPQFIKNMHKEVLFNHHYDWKVDDRVDSEYLAANRIVYHAIKGLPNIELIRLGAHLCSESNCVYEQGGAPLYKDKHHLNLHGSDQLSFRLSQEFVRL